MLGTASTGPGCGLVSHKAVKDSLPWPPLLFQRRQQRAGCEVEQRAPAGHGSVPELPREASPPRHGLRSATFQCVTSCNKHQLPSHPKPQLLPLCPCPSLGCRPVPEMPTGCPHMPLAHCSAARLSVSICQSPKLQSPESPARLSATFCWLTFDLISSAQDGLPRSELCVGILCAHLEREGYWLEGGR